VVTILIKNSLYNGNEKGGDGRIYIQLGAESRKKGIRKMVSRVSPEGGHASTGMLLEKLILVFLIGYLYFAHETLETGIFGLSLQ
jgi:hypothetical protein